MSTLGNKQKHCLGQLWNVVTDAVKLFEYN